MVEASINDLLLEVPYDPPNAKRQKLIECVLIGNSILVRLTPKNEWMSSVESILAISYLMLGKKILKMTLPSIQKFNLEDTGKLVVIIAASEMMWKYLIKQKILPEHINIWGGPEMASIVMLIRGALANAILSPAVLTCFHGCPRMTSLENEKNGPRNSKKRLTSSISSSSWKGKWKPTLKNWMMPWESVQRLASTSTWKNKYWLIFIPQAMNRMTERWCSLFWAWLELEESCSTWKAEVSANVISIMETTLLSRDHVCIKQPSNTYDQKPIGSTTSFTLLRIQLMIAPMMPDNASAPFTFTLNLPSSDAKAFSLFLSHSFMFSGLPPPSPPPPLP